MHVHLDPVGGIAGDMFIAAMLHAFPELEQSMVAAIRAAGLPASIALGVKPFQDFALTGLRFSVDEPDAANDRSIVANVENHGHRAFADIVAALAASSLDARVRDRAIAIYRLLAEVEGQIHGVATNDVSFHELGGWDSIADIVGAAYLIETCGVTSWSIGSLPKGSGMVKTAHGPLPVPSPATARLLEGFSWHDDGRPGERVTPTGAAIARSLNCSARLPVGANRLSASGYGFGTRRFIGMSNTLRVMVFAGESQVDFIRDEIAVVEFELDDQTAEDISLALIRLRDLAGVMDVLQMPAYGKKGRIATHIRILCEPKVLDTVLAASFAQTGTLGVRYHVSQRAVLPRKDVPVAVAGENFNVKVSERPGAIFTAKLEADSIRQSRAETHAERERLRRAAEEIALRQKRDES
jgi:pyridinium-3,5-bisthiocarboxylic acid mononucleotide nickel chelatase